MRNKITDFIIQNSKIIILLFLVLTAGFVFGLTEVDMESDLEQFQTDAPEVRAQNYITQNFTTPGQNQTTTQIVIRGNNVLSQDTLLDVLQAQKTIYEDESINRTLVDRSQAITGIANLVAINSIQNEKINDLRNKSTELETLKVEINQKRALVFELLNESRRAQIQKDELNFSFERNQINQTVYNERIQEINSNLTEIDVEANSVLNNSQYLDFKTIKNSIVGVQHQINQLNQSYRLDEINYSTYKEKKVFYETEIVNNYNKTQILFNESYNEVNELLDEIEEIKSELSEGDIPSIQEQINQISSLSQEKLKNNISLVFDQNGSDIGLNALALMPLDFDSNSTESEATMVFVTHEFSNTSEFGASASDKVTEVQKSIQEIFEEEISDEEVLVFGQGLVSDEINRSMTDSLTIVLPIALVFVLIALIFAYRDLLDILLGLFGILLVLVWAIGSMGLLGISFNQMFVAIPALLTGLSIDYAIHVFMRHREEREDNPEEGIHDSMKIALAGVGMALVWVTATTIIGFMSNTISPIPPIRDFGFISSIGIFSALLILGAFIPSIKIELDCFLEKKGFDRKKRAFGTSGIIKKFLSIGCWLAKNKKYSVILLVLLLTTAGAYGATKVDTTFKQEDFLAQEPPAWMDYLPEQIRPGDYSIKQNLDYLNNNFLRQDQEAQILIEGKVDSGKALELLEAAQEQSKQKDTVLRLSNGEARVQSPLTLIDQVSSQNQSFHNLLRSSDTDGDGLPEQNISMIYSELKEFSPDETQRLIYQTDSGYEAIRLIISLKGTSTSKEITNDMRDIAEEIDKEGDLEATATGSPVVFNVVENQIFSTVINSLMVALIAVLVFIAIAFKLVEGSFQLGVITIIPVIIIVIWIVGTMYALDIPFNVMTAAITNLTIGLGIDYSLHISERFKYEITEKEEDIWVAMNKTVTGTGGALLGTALTTIGGFGVLGLAILPVLKQFGLVTAITMFYSFIGGVFILPTLLGIWATSKKENEKIEYTHPIEINNLNKSYGDIEALKDIDLKIPEGVFGLIGPNGAGKTTLMNILAGTIKKYEGKAVVLGEEINKAFNIKKKIGYLPENPGFYEEMTGHQFLKYMSELYGKNEYEASKKAYEWLEKTELSKWGNKKIKKYSAGMKQKLGIAQAFINDPKVILLDEPTSELDPIAREKFLEIIKEFSEKNKTIIISTHILGELNQVADRFAVLRDGEIIDQKESNEINDLETYYKDIIGD